MMSLGLSPPTLDQLQFLKQSCNSALAPLSHSQETSYLMGDGPLGPPWPGWPTSIPAIDLGTALA